MQIEWPLSIVISQQAMTQYQLIFRHLFELKYVERQLNGVWQVLQATRGLFRWAVMNSPLLPTILVLRHDLLQPHIVAINCITVTATPCSIVEYNEY